MIKWKVEITYYLVFERNWIMLPDCKGTFIKHLVLSKTSLREAIEASLTELRFHNRLQGVTEFRVYTTVLRRIEREILAGGLKNCGKRIGSHIERRRTRLKLNRRNPHTLLRCEESRSRRFEEIDDSGTGFRRTQI